MVDWQITATTIYCDAVDDEATLMVYKDESVSCTGCKKYGQPARDVSKLLHGKGKRLNRKLECEGLGCHRIAKYRDRLFAEETGSEKGNPIGE